jgi:hypothetical protein
VKNGQQRQEERQETQEGRREEAGSREEIEYINPKS